MRYLALIYTPESEQPPNEADARQIMAEYGAFTQEIRDKGVFLGGEALQPSATATTVRVRKGDRMVTDGPFAETREQLGGYYMLECKDLDEALDWAAKIPGARLGAIEVRPIQEMGG